MTGNISLDQVIRQDEDVCAVERIQIPGAIQPHGLLVVLEAQSLALMAKSANVDGIFPPTETGQSPAWLPPVALEACRSIAAGRRSECLLLAAIDGLGWTEIHCFAAGDAVGCEFEIPSVLAAPDPTITGSLLAVAQATEEIGAAATVADLASLTARAIRDITGFERVLVYRFDDNGDGDVVGESLVDGWPQTFLGLRFPASDIPAQARALYRVSRSRWMPTCDYQPVPLVPALESAIDLSLSRFRSVSPVHRLYQRNVGVDGSMSSSVLLGGRLWGLVIGHHRQPHRISPSLRHQVDAVVQAFTLRLDSLISRADEAEMARDTQAYSAMLGKLAAADDFLNALTEGEPGILDLLPGCVGAAVIWQGDGGAHHVRHLGEVPPEPQLLALAAALRGKDQAPVTATDCISELFPDFLDFRQNASGVLAAHFDDNRNPSMLLFRPEVVTSVSWAGKPEKLIGPDGVPNLPRRSFDRWTETRRGRSAPWLRRELDMATTICLTINQVILRQARRIRHLDAEVGRFAQALSLSSTTVYHQDRDLRYSWVPLSQMGFGRDVIGCTDRDIFDAELAARMQSVKRRVLDSGVGERRTLPARLNDPNAEWFDLSVEPLFDEKGQVTGISCISIREDPRERAAMEKMSVSSSSVTAAAFGITPLSEASPGTVARLKEDYGRILADAFSQSMHRVDHGVSARLEELANELGFLNAGPRDVVWLHSQVFNAYCSDLPRSKAIAFTVEGRLVVLELMGCLAAYYRTLNLGLGRPRPRPFDVATIK